jgi:hypothetical protein
MIIDWKVRDYSSFVLAEIHHGNEIESERKDYEGFDPCRIGLANKAHNLKKLI